MKRPPHGDLSGTTAQGPRVGAYILDEPLGVGGMSVVFAATHAPTGAPVALKVHTTTRPDEVAGAAREALVTASLSHPHVVGVLDVGRLDGPLTIPPHTLPAGAPFVVMERVVGPTLAAALPAAWDGTRAVLAALLDALGHAHARGVVHCDVKPSNVLMDPQTGAARLTDFGVASVLDIARLGRDADALRGLRGTPAYMAPEQFERDGHRGPWTDLYAVGCVAWQLATGTPPFGFHASVPSLARDHRDTHLPGFVPRFATPPGLEAWTRRLLAKAPHARFRRAADAAWALAQLGAAAPEVTDAPLSPPHGPPATAAPTTLAAPAGSASPFTETVSQAPLYSQGLAPTEHTPRGAAPSAALPPLPRADAPAPTARPFPRSWVPQPPNTSPAPRAGHHTPGPPSLRSIPFLGRASERQRLWDALAAVSEQGRPRAAIISGPPGVGKSALARWLVEQSHTLGAAEPVGQLTGPVDEARADLARALHAWLQGDSRSPTSLAGDLRERLRAAGEEGSEPEETVAALLTLLLPKRARDKAPAGTRAGTRTDSIPRVRLFGQSHRRALVARLLRVAGRDRPAVLWLDDLHPEDAVGEDLAALLADPRLAAPVLLVITTPHGHLDALSHTLTRGRPDLVGDRLTTIALSPLPRHERAALYQALVGQAAPPALLEGSTTEELVQRALLWPRDIPGEGDLSAVWRARRDAALEGVGEEARGSLALATTLGPTVYDDEWRAVCAHAGLAPGGDAVARLAVAGLARYTETGWVFAQRSFHRAMLAELRAQGALVTTLGHVAAGLRALPAPSADTRLRQARAAAASGDQAAGRRGLMAAARELHTQCRWSQAEDVLTEREGLVEPGSAPQAEDVEALVLRGDIQRLSWHFQEAAGNVERARAAVRALGEPVWERRALLASGRLKHWVGDAHGALDSLRRADALFAAAGDDVGRAACALELISVLGMAGELDAAEEAAERALGALDAREARWEATLGPMFRGQVLEARGSLRRRQGETAAAGRDAARARDAYNDAGYALGVGSALNLLAETLRMEGRCAEAEPLYRQAAELWREAGSQDDVIADIGHAYCLLAREDVGAARAALGRVAGKLEPSGQRGYLVYALVGFVLCDALEGHPLDGALGRVSEELRARPQVDPDLAWALGRAAKVWRQDGGDGPTAKRLVELRAATTPT